MTNKHDGPRAGSQVTVIQSATPTRLTQAEADELDRLIKALMKARWALGYAAAAHSIQSREYVQAQQAADQAFMAVYDWQLRHGLEAK